METTLKITCGEKDELLTYGSCFLKCPRGCRSLLAGQMSEGLMQVYEEKRFISQNSYLFSEFFGPTAL